MKLYVGTSGYGYKEWKGTFYPQRIASTEMLPFYARHFNAVEINNTFYRMPSKEMLQGWAAQVSEDFVFALKAPQVITHIKRLKNAQNETERLVTNAEAMGRKLGPLLFQLPASFSLDIPRLKAFLDLLSPFMAAFEFRSPSWFIAEVFDLLRERQCALCTSDREMGPLPEVVSTAPWGYLRLRRPAYSGDDLARWHKLVATQGWKTAYVFFKHEDQAEGPAMAGRFLDLAKSGKGERTRRAATSREA